MGRVIRIEYGFQAMDCDVPSHGAGSLSRRGGRLRVCHSVEMREYLGSKRIDEMYPVPSS